jgi:hypothetical protein
MFSSYAGSGFSWLTFVFSGVGDIGPGSITAVGVRVILESFLTFAFNLYVALIKISSRKNVKLPIVALLS